MAEKPPKRVTPPPPPVTFWTWAGRVGFLAVFAACTLPSYAIALFLDLSFMRPKTPEGLRSRGVALAYISSFLWRIAMSCCLWLRIDASGNAIMHELAGKSRPVLLLVNHVSFMDTPIVCVQLPWRLIPGLKVLMAKRLMGLPILGHLAKVVGHIPLPYFSGSDNDFAMDKEELPAVMKHIDDHIDAGGHIALFPEGFLNVNWHQLEQFRGGGFEIAIRHDMEVWALVYAGTADTWSRDTALGGGPAKILSKAVCIHQSAKEASRELAPEGSLKDQGRAMANHAQAKMQEALDDLVARRSRL